MARKPGRTGLEWFMARRYLASRRKGRFLSLITLIAVGGIFVGVAALITVIAVMTGMQNELQAKILGANPHVYVFQNGQGFRMSAWREVLEEVERVPGVAGAQPFIITQVGVTPTGDYVQFGTLYGIEADGAGVPLNDIERGLRDGSLTLESGGDLPGVLVGIRLAQRLGMLEGDTVVVIAPENLKAGPLGEVIPATGEFVMTGSFETGMYEYDSGHLYADLGAVARLLDFGDDVGGLALAVDDPWEARAVGRAVSSRLSFPYYTNDWMTLNSSLFGALQLEKLAMGLILFLIVLVAAFNIVSTLIMVVTDKTREIGILKSMGMTNRAVLKIFLLQGLAIGAIGTALGAFGGLGLVWLIDRYDLITLPADIYGIPTLPVALDFTDVGLIVVLSVVIAFAATILPARQASRLMPVEAIRHE